MGRNEMILCSDHLHPRVLNKLRAHLGTHISRATHPWELDSGALQGQPRYPQPQTSWRRKLSVAAGPGRAVTCRARVLQPGRRAPPPPLHGCPGTACCGKNEFFFSFEHHRAPILSAKRCPEATGKLTGRSLRGLAPSSPGRKLACSGAQRLGDGRVTGCEC